VPPQSPLQRINPSDETIQAGPVTIRFLITGEDSGGSIAVFEFMVPAGKRLLAPAHSHDQYEETVYGVDGVITFTVDGVPIDIGAGQALCIPRGAVHRFDNNGSVDAKGYCAVTPGILGPQFFREAAAIYAEAVAGPPDRAKLMDLMRRNGITPAPPPAAT
jgi:quercetin dioxygenase-like cupin family protein